MNTLNFILFCQLKFRNMSGSNKFSNFFFMTIALLIEGAVCYKQRHFHTVSSQNCQKYNDSSLTLSIEHFKINTYNFGQKIETIINYRLKEDIDDLKMIAEISRCNNTSQNLTCEKFLERATVSDICDIMEMENTAWTNYLTTFTPHITKCPIKQGIYVSTSTSQKTDIIDLSAWFSDGLWKSRNYLYSGNRMVGCFETDVEIYTPMR